LTYLLDTNIAIYARDGVEAVLNRMGRHEGALFVSALSLAELQRGFAAPGPQTILRRIRLEKLLSAVPVLSFDRSAALAYGQIIAKMGWSHTKDMDRLIAGHALSTSSILVTANTADFGAVSGLVIEDWTLPA
jgi:tRNA(fMet)-specific endonuclease VapC